MTVLQAVAMAEGPSPDGGSRAKTIIIRQSESDSQRVGNSD